MALDGVRIGAERKILNIVYKAKLVAFSVMGHYLIDWLVE
jgi:hypothetical protein